MSELLSVKDAQDRIQSAFRRVEKESCSLADARLRVLAEDIVAGNDLPPFSNSGMDGFAVRAADVQQAGAQPVRLRVIEDIPAGSFPSREIGPGQAARIMTGAPLPSGADAIVPVEDTDAGHHLPETVNIQQSVKAGAYIRRQGQDITAGQTILRAGKRLTSPDVGMLAMLGYAQVEVFRRPRVAILSSGDELVAPNQPLSPGKIRDSNSYTLAALVEQSGAQALRLERARDDAAQIRARMQFAVDNRVDLIVTSAGVSVGAFDFVRAVIEEEGRLDFWRVNMRPGKPVAFGSYQGVPVLGLPGNPVSAFVTFLVFAVPVMRLLAGETTALPPRRKAVLTHPLESDGRESYLRAVLSETDGGIIVSLTGDQNSGNLYSLVQGNALLIVPSGVKSLPTGAVVDVWPIL